MCSMDEWWGTDPSNYRAFSHDVMAAILVFQNKETTAMLVFQDLPIILWELNSSLMQTLSFVPINLHRCCNWPREGKCSIAGGRMWTRVKLGAIIKTDIQEMKHSLVIIFLHLFCQSR